MTQSALPLASDNSERFHKKRDLILDAAARQINLLGVKGLTFVAVADAVGLNTTSITYYFKRKELLAAATFERGIASLVDMVEQAGASSDDPRMRVRKLIELHFDRVIQDRAGAPNPPIIFSDLRAFDEPVRGELIAKYEGIIYKIAKYFNAGKSIAEKARSLAMAQVLLDVLHWSRAWEDLYSDADFPRVCARLSDLLENGFAVPGAAWAPQILSIDNAPTVTRTEINPETYIRAATWLINERGYRGTSVERIAALLNVSKGSFYHHLSGKNDLVLECADRSYSRVSRAQMLAIEQDGSYWQKLCDTIATLLDVQFTSAFPLLRTIAIHALPTELRPVVVDRSNLMAQRFAGMMSDGIAEGSIRPIDTFLASQCLMAAINAGFDFRKWAEARSDTNEAIEIYAGTLAFGFFPKAT